MKHVPLLIEFAPHTSLYRERELVSQLPIIRNGPAGTFLVFPGGLRVSLPRTDRFGRRYRRLRSSGVWRDAVRRIGRGTPGVHTDSRTVPGGSTLVRSESQDAARSAVGGHNCRRRPPCLVRLRASTSDSFSAAFLTSVGTHCGNAIVTS